MIGVEAWFERVSLAAGGRWRWLCEELCCANTQRQNQTVSAMADMRDCELGRTYLIPMIVLPASEMERGKYTCIGSRKPPGLPW